MDFFEAQDRARKGSQRLVVLFGLAIGTLILGTYLMVWLLTAPEVTTGSRALPPFFQPGLFALVVVGLGLPIAGGTLYRTSQLRKGGAVVAELLGGRRVEPGTTDPRERILMNVVEEIALASGVPVPAVFVLDQEDGMNAFAAGHTLHDAAVAITRGALEGFTRDELQGVMAHEFSHILNGDMRLNIRLMGLLFGILLLAVMGRGLLRTSYSRSPRIGGRGGKKDGSAQVVLGLALVVLGYLGVWIGRLLQAAISREREFLADAAAVQFTRNPWGIANALKRIGIAQDGSRIRDSHVDEAGHLFFARGGGSTFTRLSSTHPPLNVRILRLDPSWDGSFEVAPVTSPPPLEPNRQVAGDSATKPRKGLTDVLSGEAGSLVAAILSSAGTVMPAHLEEAQRRLRALPDEIRARMRTGEGAMEAILALAFSDLNDPSQGEQVARDRLGHGLVDGAIELQRIPAWQARELRIPILEIALPSLSHLSRERAQLLIAFLSDLMTQEGSSGPLPAFGFALVHRVRRQLLDRLGQGDPSIRLGTTSREEILEEGRVLLSLLARYGADDPSLAESAFEGGWSIWSEEVFEEGSGRGANNSLLASDTLSLQVVETAMDRLEGAAPGVRRVFLQAAAMVVAFDGILRLEELELLRLLSEAVEIPLPPLALSG